MVKKKDHIQSLTRSLHKPRVFFQVGDAPMVTVGKGTLTLTDRLAGGRNVAENESMNIPSTASSPSSRRPGYHHHKFHGQQEGLFEFVRKWQDWKRFPL